MAVHSSVTLGRHAVPSPASRTAAFDKGGAYGTMDHMSDPPGQSDGSDCKELDQLHYKLALLSYWPRILATYRLALLSPPPPPPPPPLPLRLSAYPTGTVRLTGRRSAPA